MNTYISRTEYGLGVFARHHIASGEIIEACPALIYDNQQSISPDDHSFEWQDGSWCILLGHGSLYNHSSRPNAAFVRDYAGKSMLFVSLCHIDPHTEIFTNYSGDIYSQEAQWFEADSATGLPAKSHQDPPPPAPAQNFFSGPHMIIADARGYPAFFAALGELVPPGSVLQLEGHPHADVDVGLQPWRKAQFSTTERFWRTLPKYVVPITAENMLTLARLAENHPGPEVADHVLVLHGDEQLLHWYDAPSDPIHISGTVDAEKVARFAQRLGATLEKIPGIPAPERYGGGTQVLTVPERSRDQEKV